MEPKYLILIALSIMLSSMLTISLLGSYPGPDSETRCKSNWGWMICAYVKGWYKQNDEYHYYHTYHKAWTHLSGLVWYHSDLEMWCYGQGYSYYRQTSNEYLVFEIINHLTSYAKTVARREFNDIWGNVWTAKVSADIVASP